MDGSVRMTADDSCHNQSNFQGKHTLDLDGENNSKRIKVDIKKEYCCNEDTNEQGNNDPSTQTENTSTTKVSTISLDPLNYTKSKEFTSEIFKIQIYNLPKFGFADLKKKTKISITSESHYKIKRIEKRQLLMFVSDDNTSRECEPAPKIEHLTTDEAEGRLKSNVCPLWDTGYTQQLAGPMLWWLALTGYYPSFPSMMGSRYGLYKEGSPAVGDCTNLGVVILVAIPVLKGPEEDQKGIEAFCLASQHLVYVSCNPESAMDNFVDWTELWKETTISITTDAGIETDKMDRVEEMDEVTQPSINEQILFVLNYSFSERLSLCCSQSHSLSQNVSFTADKEVLKRLRKCDSIRHLVYVSCNPESAMDNFVDIIRPETGRHKGRPFRMVKATPVDLFPGTKHRELVLLYTRDTDTTKLDRVMEKSDIITTDAGIETDKMDRVEEMDEVTQPSINEQILSVTEL
ncbi:hypothetical protein Btru_001549 [Bulinus truncatus]|nr:hypothetical protein Btru_001549 [Bulinus truncatus]